MRGVQTGLSVPLQDCTALPSLHERFWRRVWKCEHPRPCRTCCWPWMRVEGSFCHNNWPSDRRCVGRPPGCFHYWAPYGMFSDPRLPRACPAHRFAFEDDTGSQLFPSIANGRPFVVARHVVCAWKACCNPSHVAPGTVADNNRDHKRWWCHVEDYRPIFLPDGRILTHENTPMYGPSVERSWLLYPSRIMCEANDRTQPYRTKGEA
jgi:hypothetical protein